MGTPFMSEIRIMSFNFAPHGWATCNGQLLPINQNQALFSLLGTTYGGDGRVNFGLPNLRGRMPIHMGNHNLGEVAGEENHTLSTSEMPAHTHVPTGTTAEGVSANPNGNLWAGVTQDPIYVDGNGDTAMAVGSIANTGGNQSHSNMQPYLVLNFCIALQGAFPSQN